MPGQQVRDSRFDIGLHRYARCRPNLGKSIAYFLQNLDDLARNCVLVRALGRGLERPRGLRFPARDLSISQIRSNIATIPPWIPRVLQTGFPVRFYGRPLPDWGIPESNITVLYFSPRWLCGAPGSGMPISLALPNSGKVNFSREAIQPYAAG
jgi:hypothetical protein